MSKGMCFGCTAAIIIACLIGAGSGKALVVSSLGWIAGAIVTGGFSIGFTVPIRYRDPFTFPGLAAVVSFTLIRGLWEAIQIRSFDAVESTIYITYACLLLYILAVAAGSILRGSFIPEERRLRLRQTT